MRSLWWKRRDIKFVGCLKQTAGLSTALRFGRDDKFWVVRGRPGRKVGIDALFAEVAAGS